MTATRVVEALVGAELEREAPISEATVRLPPRGGIWIATFTGPEGQQIWRSTGLRQRDQALLVAKKWEFEAKQQRERFRIHRKASIRVRRGPHSEPGELSQKEVAILLKISERAVREIERRAFRELRSHPLLKKIWQEYCGEVDENVLRLTQAEIEAIFALAQAANERQALQNLLRLIGLDL